MLSWGSTLLLQFPETLYISACNFALVGLLARCACFARPPRVEQSVSRSPVLRPGLLDVATRIAARVRPGFPCDLVACHAAVDSRLHVCPDGLGLVTAAPKGIAHIFDLAWDDVSEDVRARCLQRRAKREARPAPSRQE